MVAGKMAVWNRICVPYLSWRDEEIVCRSVHGSRFRVRPSDFVENRLCFFGSWEPAVTQQFESLIQPGDVVIDVGANIGYYSVLSSKLVGSKGRVYALEPSASIRARLEANLRLNSCNNVTVLPFGAWHETGTAKLNLVDGNRGSSTIGSTENSHQSEQIHLKRLDEMIPQSEWERIRLIKIDVEGAELSAVQGAEKILNQASHIEVICEVCPERMEAVGGACLELLHLMQGHGFSGFEIGNDYSPAAYISNKTNPIVPLAIPLVASCDVLFRRIELSEQI
jgi:FkbM family methyltransferase